MQKWLRATLVSATALGGLAAAASPAASAATGEATARSDVLAATAAADAKIPHKIIGGEASPTGASKPEVRPASVTQPTPGAALQRDREVTTPGFWLWPINCDVSAAPPFKTGTHLYGRSMVDCEEATDGRYTSKLQYSNDKGKTWVTYGSRQERTQPGTGFIVQKEIACASSAPYRYWRTYGEIFYNWFLNQYKTETDASPKVMHKC